MKEKEKLKEIELIKYIEELSVKTRGYNRRLIINSIGDDCAIFKDSDRMLVSSDSITENVHFDLNSYGFYEIGKKSLLVNISDIAAMGGIPRLFILSFFIPEYVCGSDIKQMLHGIIDSAEENRVSLIGGNISKSPVLSISATIIGDYKNDKVLKRHSSEIGDDIYVSGELGNAWMVYYLRNNKDGIGKNMPGSRKADKMLIENFIEKFKLPVPRVGLGKKLSAGKLANSLTDISDGLTKDIYNLLGKNSGFEIDLDEIPVNEDLKYISRKASVEDYTDYAVYFGEDYEILWTARAGMEKNFLKLSTDTGVAVKKIGHITGKPGAAFIKNGRPYRVKDFTFKHL